MDAYMLFILMGFVGLYMSYKLFKRYLVMSFWAFMQVIFSIRYKVVFYGLENIPKDKAILLLGNHISWLDWLFLQIPLKKRINYMMDKEIYNWKVFHSVLKKGEVIPLSPKAFKDAIKEAANRLKKGNIVALFPEGGITTDCKIQKFKRGFELIEEFNFDGVIIPFYLDGMQGSVFAKCNDGRRKPLFKREVKVCFLKPIKKDIKADELQSIIEENRC
jgi:acyl-[acyl-carrier-protein]-phospholipid O-acyltransferase/long-chain-fatty-acid--[acyl-carrier-protein] ligase